jgi:hypothetical protein
MSDRKRRSLLCKIGIHRWIAVCSELFCSRCLRWEDDIANGDPA